MRISQANPAQSQNIPVWHNAWPKRNLRFAGNNGLFDPA